MDEKIPRHKTGAVAIRLLPRPGWTFGAGYVGLGRLLWRDGKNICAVLMPLKEADIEGGWVTTKAKYAYWSLGGAAFWGIVFYAVAYRLFEY
ncbi:MAG: hypothetical protein ACRD2P_18925, partial [Terriglobia bacterium]